jgi:RNA polymerase sigma-70 factor (ECF subfamily)
LVLSQLPVDEARVGFRSRATVDCSPEAARQVRLAIAAAKEGDRDALRFLYVRYCDNVWSYVRSIVRDEHEAEDVTQHVFAKLMSIIDRYDDRGVPFSSWLLRVARNAALDHLRVRRATPTEAVAQVESGIEDDGINDRMRSLIAALDSLPDEQRNVVIMRHVVGLSPAEIAERMGRSESSIHGLHHRGRRALQRELRRLGSAPSTKAAHQLSAAC